MTQFPDHPADSYAPQPGSAMAITALVLSCIGLVICGPVGLIGVILGIIVLVRANAVPPKAAGKGMAIAAIAVGGVSLLLMILLVPLLIGILLPALSKARESAKEIVSTANIREMCQALATYANDHDNAFPASADDWHQTLTNTGMVTADIFISPRTDGIGKDYFYVPGLTFTFDSDQVLIYEDPMLDPDATIIGFGDMYVRSVPQAEALRILSGLTLPDGTVWAPHLDPSEQGP